MRKPHPLYSWAIQAPAPLRWSVGLLLIAGGALGFLPVLGFWMIPLGVLFVASGSRRVRETAKRVMRWSYAQWCRLTSKAKGGNGGDAV